MNVKPGYLTTEFWVTVLGVVGVVLLMALGRLSVDDLERLWPLVAGTGLYALSRGITKHGGG